MQSAALPPLAHPCSVLSALCHSLHSQDVCAVSSIRQACIQDSKSGKQEDNYKDTKLLDPESHQQMSCGTFLCFCQKTCALFCAAKAEGASCYDFVVSCLMGQYSLSCVPARNISCTYAP